VLRGLERAEVVALFRALRKKEFLAKARRGKESQRGEKRGRASSFLSSEAMLRGVVPKRGMPEHRALPVQLQGRIDPLSPERGNFR